MCTANDIPIVVIKGENGSSGKILLIRKESSINISTGLIENEINKFFPKTISFINKFFGKDKYEIHTCRKMISAQYDVAIKNMLKIADWDFCAIEINESMAISRYECNSVIYTDTHNIGKCYVVPIDQDFIDYMQKHM